MSDYEHLILCRTVREWRMISHALRVAFEQDEFPVDRQALSQLAKDLDASLPLLPSSDSESER